MLPSLVLLGNHGIITLSETAERAEGISLMAVKSARVRTGAYGAGGIVRLSDEAVSKYFAREDIVERRRSLSGMIGQSDA